MDSIGSPNLVPTLGSNPDCLDLTYDCPEPRFVVDMDGVKVPWGGMTLSLGCNAEDPAQ